MKTLAALLVLLLCTPAIAVASESTTVRVYYSGVAFGVDPPANDPYVAVVTKMGTSLSVTLYRDEVPFDSATLTVGDSFYDIRVIDGRDDPNFDDVWLLDVAYKTETDTDAYMAFIPQTPEGYMCAAENCVIGGCGLSIDLSKVPDDKQGAFDCDEYRCAWHCQSGSGDVVAYFPPNAGNPYCNESEFAIVYPDDVSLEKDCSGSLPDDDPTGGGETDTSVPCCCSGFLPGMFVIPLLGALFTRKR